MATSKENRNENILIVDDDQFLRDLLFRYLSQLGYRVVLAETGAEAITIVQETSFKVAVIDILLAGMTGIELVDKLSLMNPEMILIMMTGHPSLETALEAMKKGVQDYLIKPFKLEQLEKVLQKCLEEKRILLENQKLRQELEEAKEQIERYEVLLSQPHRMSMATSDEMVAESLGNRAYQSQSLKTKENTLDKLENLKEEGIISEDEFEVRRKRLNTIEGKG